MNDLKEMGMLYEAVASSCIMHVSNKEADVCNEDDTAIILMKIDKLICNAKNFNDEGGLVALTTLKNFIQEL